MIARYSLFHSEREDIWIFSKQWTHWPKQRCILIFIKDMWRSFFEKTGAKGFWFIDVLHCSKCISFKFLISNLNEVKTNSTFRLYLRYMLRFFVDSVEAVAQRCFVKKVFLEISQNSEESTRAWKRKTQENTYNFIRKDFGTGVFLWVLRNFLERLFLQNTSGGCFWQRKLK